MVGWCLNGSLDGIYVWCLSWLVLGGIHGWLVFERVTRWHRCLVFVLVTRWQVWLVVFVLFTRW